MSPQKKGADRFAHVGLPVATASVESTAETSGEAPDVPPESFDVPYKETVQLNVNMSPALRTAIRAKALRLGIPLTAALKQVLERWVAED